MGTSPPETPEVPDSPSGPETTISEIIPDRTVPADTVRISGSGFGDAQEASRVLFAGAAGGVEASVLSWEDAEIVVLAPAGAEDGPLRVVTDAGASNPLAFSLAPEVVSYVDDVAPIFSMPSHGCTSCHTGIGNGNFLLGSREEILRGDSDHGPVVVRRHSKDSALIHKLRGTADFGTQMPPGGVPVADEFIQTIADWIDQGTRDN
jgi:hypothetical protein